MKSLQMKLVGADIRTKKDGSAQYMKVQFAAEYNNETLKASLNISDTDENIDLVDKLYENGFTTNIEFDEDDISDGTFQGKEYHATDVKNIKEVKDAMGVKKMSLAEALKAKRR